MHLDKKKSMSTHLGCPFVAVVVVSFFLFFFFGLRQENLILSVGK